MNNVICLELSNMTEDQLKSACSKFKLDYDVFLNNKLNNGIVKVFVDLDYNQVFAWVHESDLGIVRYSELILDFILLDMKPHVEKVVFDYNVILDKIDEYGIESLLTEELDFLKNESLKVN